ncbi:MAG: hypothetical protein ACREHD_00965 [Pirellulales bacterium]
MCDVPQQPGSPLDLDDGKRVSVPEDQRDRFVEALRCLHESHPGIRIDTQCDAIRWQSNLDDDPFTNWLHQSDIWLSNPELRWLTPADKVYPY